MTLGTLINIAVNVAVAAVNVVSAIATQGNNFIANAVNTVAGWFGGGSNSGSSHSSGGSSSNRGASSVISFEEQRRIAVQQRQQRQSLERDISYSLEQSEPEEEPPLDFADLLLPALVPAEIMLAAWGNPVAESMVIMLRNERGLFEAMMSAAASPVEGLRNLFAEAGRNDEWDAYAVNLYKQWVSQRHSDGDDPATMPTEQSPEPQFVAWEQSPEQNNALWKPALSQVSDIVTREDIEGFPIQYAEWTEQTTILNTRITSLNQQRDNILARLSATDSDLAERILHRRLREIEGLIAQKVEEKTGLEALLKGALGEYESMIEQVLGYEIELYDEQLEEQPIEKFSVQERIDQLANLTTANLLTVDFLDDVLADSGIEGLDVFRQYFAQTPDGTPITVHVGDNSRTGGAYLGYVPLPNRAPEEELDDIYLGSEISISTTIHEFFHHIDRVSGLALSSETTNEGLYNFLGQQSNFAGTIGLPRGDVLEPLLLGRANPQIDAQEIFADIGMTAVLDGLGVRRADEVGVFADESENELIGWDYEDNQNAPLVANAVREYFRQLFTRSQ